MYNIIFILLPLCYTIYAFENIFIFVYIKLLFENSFLLLLYIYCLLFLNSNCVY